MITEKITGGTMFEKYEPAPQPVSAEQMKKKYFLRDKQDVHLEDSISDVRRRVSAALAQQEVASSQQLSLDNEQLYNSAVTVFAAALESGAICGGRIMSNAGALGERGSVSLINCIGSGVIEDSMDSIFHRLHQAALLLKSGCGVGYCFSTLRPEGASVGGAGASTNGPIAFMKVYDTACETVSSAGGRRGAQMGTFNLSHPDALKVMAVKQKDGMLRFFNLSMLVTNSFMDKVAGDLDWDFTFEGKVYGTAKAADVWNEVAKNTYENSEPGVIFIDTINRMNNLWFCEEIDTTNPCGEQPLPPFGACLLGSLDATKFVMFPFTDTSGFDMKGYITTIQTFTRMLDNVVEMANLPLQEFTDELLLKRRHGMGYLGLGSAMTMLGIPYGSKEAVEFTEKVTRTLALENYRMGAILAEEKGEAPILKQMFEITQEMVDKNDNLLELVANDTHRIGDKVTGRTLWLMSHFFDRFKEDPEGMEVYNMLCESGSRFTHATSLAPTGTIALALANNASNGIEPTFDHFYIRNITKDDRATREQQPVFSREFLTYRMWYLSNWERAGWQAPPAEPTYFISSRLEGDQVNVVEKVFNAWMDIMPEVFKSRANDLTPKQHLEIQAAAQKWIDSSISKTVNCPTDITFEDFKEIYTLGHKLGCKGLTTYRYNPEVTQGILVRPEDLRRNTYVFHLQDGTAIEARGDETIEYMGLVHNAANLYEALKEGKL